MNKKRYAAAVAVLVIGMFVMSAPVAALPGLNGNGNQGGSGNGSGGDTGGGGENGDRPDTSGFELNQNVGFGEVVTEADGSESGIYVNGLLFELGDFVNETYGTELEAFGGDFEVVANWSDNLILHQWTAGQKVRTEVILWDPANEASVYTIRARFTIDKLDEDMGFVSTVWSGSITDRLWKDGNVDGYSSEINQLGQLLFGYNWDTRGETPGYYRLTFTIEAETEIGYVPYDADYGSIEIVGVDDLKYWDTENCKALEIGFTSSSTTIVVELLDGSGGR